MHISYYQYVIQMRLLLGRIAFLPESRRTGVGAAAVFPTTPDSTARRKAYGACPQENTSRSTPPCRRIHSRQTVRLSYAAHPHGNRAIRFQMSRFARDGRTSSRRECTPPSVHSVTTTLPPPRLVLAGTAAPAAPRRPTLLHDNEARTAGLPKIASAEYRIAESTAACVMSVFGADAGPAVKPPSAAGILGFRQRRQRVLQLVLERLHGPRPAQAPGPRTHSCAAASCPESDTILLEACSCRRVFEYFAATARALPCSRESCLVERISSLVIAICSAARIATCVELSAEAPGR